MGPLSFLKSKLVGQSRITVDSELLEEFIKKSEQYTRFRLTETALFTAVDLIARTIAKCEFVTVENHRSVCKYEYFLWNFQPNRNQTKAEFINEFISKLIFKNEALIVETSDGQLLIADSFGHTKKAVVNDIFSGVTARNYTFNRTFKSSEVIYLQYSNIAVNNLIAEMCSAYQSLMKDAAEKYAKQTGHKVILEIDANQTGDKDFNNKLNELMTVHFKSFFSQKNAVLPMYKGFKYNEPTTDAKNKAVSEVNDLKQLRAEAFSTVGNALHIPPALIAGETSGLSDAVDSFIGEAIDPIARMLAQVITQRRYGEDEFLKGNYLFIDTTFARHIDAVSSANNLDKAISSGVLSPYNAQRYCNMLPSPDAWAHEYYITKNYQNANDMLKGGENNA